LGGEAYSTKVGQIPKNQRVHHTFKATSEVTVSSAPRSSNPSVSQLAAVDAAGGPIAIGIKGERVHPTALFGLISDSVIGPVCRLGIAVPGPMPTPNTVKACPQPLTYQETPVWVVEYKDVAIAATGGARGGGALAPSPTPNSLHPASPVLFEFVSAKSGKVLFGES
jgi:hypothetical protein